jgi:hypothetical protein
MGETCSTRRSLDKSTVFQSNNLKGRDGFGDLRIRCKDNIKTDNKRIGCDCVDWTIVAQNRAH